MYIIFSDLVNELQRSVTLQCYNIDPKKTIMGIDLLPVPYDPQKNHLDADVLYLCDFWQIEQLSPLLSLPPLICAVAKGANLQHRHLCNRNIVAVYDCTFYRLFVLLMNATYNLGCKSSLQAEVAHTLLKCTSIAQLFDEGYRAIKNPLVLTDSNEKIIFHTSPELVTNPFYRDFLSDQYLPFGQLNPQINFPAEDSRDIPFTIDWDNAGAQIVPAVCKILYVGKQRVGYLYSPQCNHVTDDLMLSIFSLLGDLLAICLEKQIVAVDESKYNLENFMKDALDRMADALDGKAKAPNMDLQNHKLVNVSLKKTLYAMSFHLRNASPRLDHSYSSLLELIRQSLHSSCAIYHKNCIFVLIDTDQEISDFHAFLQPMFSELFDHGMLVGISKAFATIAGLENACFQARKAVHLGTALHPSESIYTYEAYSVYHMAEMCLKFESVDNLCHPGLLKLQSYCQKNGPELLDTLNVYIETGFNQSATAKSMYLHLSTAKYRFSQIEKIAGVDLSDKDTMWKLTFSLKILELSRLTLPPI